MLEVEWGADVDHFRPDAAGPRRRSRATRVAICCVFAGAFRSWHGVVHLSAALARLHARRRPPVRRASSSATARSARPPSARRAACPASIFTGAVPHARAAGRARGRRHRRRAVRPDAARAAAAGLLLVAAQDLRIHGRGPAGRRARAAAARPAGRAWPRGTAVRSGRSARRSTARSSRWPIRRCGGGWARPRARGSSATSAGTAHCAALDARLRALVTAMSAPLRVLIVTDSFPPVCGGSGWSTWELVARPASRAGTTSKSCKIEAGAADAASFETHVRGRARHDVPHERAATCRSSATS